MTASIHVFPDPSSLARAGAGAVVEVLGRCTEGTGPCTLALAGGSTPVDTYRILAQSYRDALSWSDVRFLQGDERMVPPDHEDSNFRMARRELLAPLSVGDEAILRISGEMETAEAAAAAYEARLLRLFRSPPHTRPRIDLVLLGLGEDGHTASLMPECPRALGEEERLVTWCRPPHLPHPRVTLTLPVLNAAREIVFLVSGRRKSEILKRVLEARNPTDLLPAQRIRPDGGRVRWLVDADAARDLSPHLREKVAIEGGPHTT
jgi:6-phosphogluconolactonase